MDTTIASSLYCSVVLIFLFLLPVSRSISPSTTNESFLRCLRQYSVSDAAVTTTANTSAFTTLFNSTVQNPRTVTHKTTKPALIVSPTRESHVQSVVICARRLDVHLRVRSGGHDYEGLSYVSHSNPFVLVDLAKLRSVSVNATDKTVWVQSGATLGELYYTIAKKAGPTLGFPAGTCPTVGVGGHFSGGGFGSMVRAYGTAADHVVDARVVSADGEIKDRKSMGEDLFWAIRGGGGSFGVILSYKVELVHVPPKVTVFYVHRTVAQAKLVTQWQHLAPKADERLFVRIILLAVPLGQEKGNRSTVRASFNSMFLGSKEELLPLMEAGFPELGLEERDCREMSWADSTLFFSGYLDNGRNLSALLDRGHDLYFSSFKAKSDFVTDPISEEGWERILSTLQFLQGGGGEDNIVTTTSSSSSSSSPPPPLIVVLLEPLGGRMDAISETWNPFPHRKGNLYNIQYMVKWGDDDAAAAAAGGGGGGRVTKRNMDCSRRLYKFMTPYVSKNPRSAYSNYRDLDLGRNVLPEGESTTTIGYHKARVWGKRYYGVNFRRLASIKAMVDPHNFFRNEQSVPPLYISHRH